MFILKYKNYFLALSLIAVLASLFSIFNFGLKKSIDFTGGTRVVVQYPVSANVNAETIKNNLTVNFKDTKVVSTKVSTEVNTFKITMPNLSASDYEKVNASLKSISPSVKVDEFTVIGPSISSEVTTKAILGFILVALAIILFVTISFIGVSQPVSSFKYGIVTIIALLHDIAIPAGVFAFLGLLYGVEVDALFVVALLTILGVSVSDTIVIFDRIRENLQSHKNKSFEEVVGMSLDQSLVRSLATSVSVIAVLIALYVYGPDSTKYFALTLTIGMFVGTYSSIFVASPLLVYAAKYFKTK
jgi:preprotein translocase subunit SecF